MSQNFDVFFVSNGTCITSETMGLSLLAQFPDHDFNTRIFPFVDTLGKTETVARHIRESAEFNNKHPIVICTMQDPDLIAMIRAAPCVCIDPFGDYVPRLENALSTTHHTPGQTHRLADRRAYDSRISAIEFTLAHDDGGTTREYDQAEIILIGVSRTGKTPSSLYLAVQFGIKAANYPITEEDLDSDQLPRPLRNHQKRLYGLTTDPNRLANLRQTRRPNSRYSSVEQCRYELRAVENLYRQHSISFLNTSTMSVEEISAYIIRDTGLHRVTQKKTG
ncbi:MAG: pyruvate, water dikinase regulatory protein [Pseudomonadota bacterium]